MLSASLPQDFLIGYTTKITEPSRAHQTVQTKSGAYKYNDVTRNDIVNLNSVSHINQHVSVCEAMLLATY